MTKKTPPRYNLAQPADRERLTADVWTAISNSSKRSPISMQEIQVRVDCHQVAIRKAIALLIEEGCVDRVGNGAATRYHKIRANRPRRPKQAA